MTAETETSAGPTRKIAIIGYLPLTGRAALIAHILREADALVVEMEASAEICGIKAEIIAVDETGEFDLRVTRTTHEEQDLFVTCFNEGAEAMRRQMMEPIPDCRPLRDDDRPSRGARRRQMQDWRNQARGRR